MGHLVGKDLYRKLGRKIDGLTMRAPWNEALFAVLKELYSEEEAELVVKMPWGLSKLHRLERVTGIPRARLERQLESMCPRGLVMDVARPAIAERAAEATARRGRTGLERPARWRRPALCPRSEGGTAGAASRV